jgi:hypothetical protein
VFGANSDPALPTNILPSGLKIPEWATKIPAKGPLERHLQKEKDESEESNASSRRKQRKKTSWSSFV